MVNTNFSKYPFSVRVIVRLLLYTVALTILLNLILRMIYLFNHKGQLRINGTINSIEAINATGLKVELIDIFENQAVSLYFDQSIMIDGYTGIYVMNDKYEWVKPEYIILEPESKDAEIWLDLSINSERVDYEISASSLFEDGSDYSCRLSYLSKEKDDYKYRFDSPVLCMDIYWQGEQQKDILLMISGCRITDNLGNIYQDREEVKTLRIPVEYFLDKIAEGNWNVFNIEMVCRDRIPGLHFEFAPLGKRETDIEHTYIEVFYPETFNGEVSGEAIWSYGISNKNLELKRQKVFFRESILNIEDKIANATEYVTGNILFYRQDNDTDDGEAIIETERNYVPQLILMTDEDNKNREVRVDYSTTVTRASINGYSLFPNLKTYLAENWIGAMTVTIAIAALSFVISRNESEKNKV